TSAAPALLVLFIRAAVPESPGWKTGGAPKQTLQTSGLAAGAIGVAFAILGELSLFTNLLDALAIPKAVGVVSLALGLVITPFAFGRKHFGLALFAMLLMASFNSFSHGTQDLYPNFLRIQHGLDIKLASLITAAASAAAIFGGISFGLLSQAIGRRRA